MTQQNILIRRSSESIKNTFISHIKKAISSNNLTKEYDLHNLHHSLTSDNLLKKGTDQSTSFHKAFYSTFDKPDFFQTDFWESYKTLCIEIIEELKEKTGYIGNWAIQRYPTIRFHFPQNVSVFEFHRDSNYSHPLGEINCFYACNECKNSSALQIEKNLGFEDYYPLNLKSGEYALLNTSIFKHGDIPNKTKNTRVSLDFRFIPSRLLNEEKISLTKGIKFTTDSYFVDEKEILILRDS